MCIDGVAQSLEFAIDPAPAERRLEGARIDGDVEVFGEPLDQVPSLGETRPAFEDHRVAIDPGDDPQGFGDVVVLLDQGGPQPPFSEKSRRLDDGLIEVRVLEEPHEVRRVLACHRLAAGSAPRCPKS